MIKSLWLKFLILLFAVSLIALSAAFILRGLMIHDFREYLEGEREDRVSWITADIERIYEKYGGWKREIPAELSEDAVWAFMLGFEVRILDAGGKVVVDTESALATLSPLVRNRVLGLSEGAARKQAGSYLPYPLFLAGKEIGRIEVRFLQPQKESVFIERSNKFLLFSLLALGGLALVLSLVLSRRLTRPLKRLAAAAVAVSEGDLRTRVPVTGKDEICRLSETFNRMAQTLEAQEALRKKLVSNTAHELRTPLSVMQGELEGMLDGLIPINRPRLGSLLEETGRLRNILDGMEELAQAQASVLTLRKQHLALDRFLAQVVSRFYPAALAVEFKVACEEGLTVYADPDRLTQIMINLLSNALKAIDGAGRVTVSAARKGAEVLIVVQDTGAGIKPEDLPLIFTRFFKGFAGGFGLGLAIVKELVEGHGGRIEARSEYGKGSVFTISLPAA